MGKLYIVVEPVFHGGSGGKLGVRPDPQNGGRHHMGAGVAQPLQVRHTVPVIQTFSFELLVFV
jgi:hypothetical protein